MTSGCATGETYMVPANFPGAWLLTLRVLEYKWCRAGESKNLAMYTGAAEPMCATIGDSVKPFSVERIRYRE
eukprot:359936-Amorphochlora_amoeboformis.AAC.2